MELPEARDEDVALDDTLLLGSVNAAAIHKSKLQPGSVGVSMADRSFVFIPVGGGHHVLFNSVSEGVASMHLTEFLVLVSELIPHKVVESLSSILPLSNFSLRHCLFNNYNYIVQSLTIGLLIGRQKQDRDGKPSKVGHKHCLGLTLVLLELESVTKARAFHIQNTVSNAYYKASNMRPSISMTLDEAH